MTTRLMPFGKFAGYPIEEVPRQYLRWLVRQGQLYGQLKDDVERVIAGRPLLPTNTDLEVLANLVVARSQ